MLASPRRPLPGSAAPLSLFFFFLFFILLLAPVALASNLSLPALTARSGLLARGAACAHKPTKCARGLLCVPTGPTSRRHCVPASLAQRAGARCVQRRRALPPRAVDVRRADEMLALHDSTCGPALSCQRGRCRVSRGAPCDRRMGRSSGSSGFCEKGLACLGGGPKGAQSRCVAYRRAGMACSLDPRQLAYCAPHLVCDRAGGLTCRVRAGGDCAAARNACADGTACTKRRWGPARGKFRCVRVKRKTSPAAVAPKRGVGPGGRCSHAARAPARRCRSPLVCHAGRCRRGSVKRRGKCRAARAACVPGLVCAGPWANRICVRPVRKGRWCAGSPYKMCASGLRCIRNHCK